MIASAKVNGKLYTVDEDGTVSYLKGNSLKSSKMKITSPILKKLLKRVVGTMVDRADRHASQIDLLKKEVAMLNDKLDKKCSQLRDLKADIEDKVHK